MGTPLSPSDAPLVGLHDRQITPRGRIRRRGGKAELPERRPAPLLTTVSDAADHAAPVEELVVALDVLDDEMVRTAR